MKVKQMRSWSFWKKVSLGFVILLGILVQFFFYISLMQPSNDLNWKDELTVQSYAEFEDDLVHLYNIRNSTYDDFGRTSLAYYNKSFDESEIVDVWFFIQPFGAWDKVAHTFVSFDFSNGEVLTLSIEVRSEVGETYGAIKGLLNQFEILYVWGDEKDLILRRTVWLNDTLYMYKLNTSDDFGTSFFHSLLDKTNELIDEPAFYHTLKSSCTSSLVEHVNGATPGTISVFDHEKYFPGITDRFLYHNGFLDVNNSYPDFRASHDIREKSRAYRLSEDGDFSTYLRE